jgi:hypothetical protein
VKSFVAFVFAVPLAVEVLGALMGIVDARRQPDGRAAAVERLTVPLLAWGFLWWWIGAGGWAVMFGAMALVIAAHVVAFYATRWLLRRPAWQTIAIDTDTAAAERAPATTGIGKGERNLSPGLSTGALESRPSESGTSRAPD